MSGLTDDDLDHIVERWHSTSLETDVDVGEIQIFPTGQLAWLKMCVKVPVIVEENSDDNDESGELAGCIIHVFLLIIQTVSFKIKCECHNKAKESQYDLNLLSSTPWPEVLHQVAQKFNVYDLPLQLQYIFPNEKTTALYKVYFITSVNTKPYFSPSVI